MEALLWTCAGLLLFTVLGYPAFSTLLARLYSRPLKKDARHQPPVSVVIAVRDEAARVRARIENLLASDYPPDRIEIIVVSDASGDGTASEVRSLNLPNVRLIERKSPSGKAACLNAGIEAATGDIVVFADARQRFGKSAIRELAACFADPQVGAVSGELEIDPASSAPGSGIDAYWRMEKAVRRAEAACDSCIGCTGAIYAIRRGLFTQLRTDTILDDVVVPMQIAMKGWRVAFESEALAFDPQTLEPGVESRRKLRTLAGNFQMLARHPRWLLPWKNRLWWRLLAHKYLRLAMPLFLGLMLVANGALCHRPFYLALLVAHLAVYALGVCGLLFPRIKIRPLAWPAAFLFLNWTILQAFTQYLINRQPVWAPAPRAGVSR
jgi:cellulose synthase/poly-beta-1,6-N-acetylglucosamine synthase-like glycosyltransferase